MASTSSVHFNVVSDRLDRRRFSPLRASPDVPEHSQPRELSAWPLVDEVGTKISIGLWRWHGENGKSVVIYQSLFANEQKTIARNVDRALAAVLRRGTTV